MGGRERGVGTMRCLWGGRGGQQRGGGPPLQGRGPGVRGVQEKAGVQALEEGAWDLGDAPVMGPGSFRSRAWGPCWLRKTPWPFSFSLCRAAPGLC